MLIVPAILVPTYQELLLQLTKYEQLFNYVHLDITDGQFVRERTLEEVERLGELKTSLLFELHLMVNDPLAVMKKVVGLKSVFRILIHCESPTNINSCLAYAREQNWQTGVVLNPNTTLEQAKNYLGMVDVVMFMTVYPGAQGSDFQPEVLKKINSFTSVNHVEERPTEGRQIINNKIHPVNKNALGLVSPLCAVDGHVNAETILPLREAGVEIFNVGSAFSRAEDPKEILLTLQRIIEGGQKR